MFTNHVIDLYTLLLKNNNNNNLNNNTHPSFYTRIFKMKFLNIGLEAIAFQSEEFATKMTSLIEKVMEVRSGKAADDLDAAKDLNKLVRNTTGIKVDIIFNTDYPPCTLPFHINPDTILGHSSLKDFYVEDSIDFEEIGEFKYLEYPKWYYGNFFKQSRIG